MEKQEGSKPTAQRPERPRAVVLDANCMPRGRVDLDRLRKWADDLSSESIELWLPETVVWEWAEHAAAERSRVTSAYRKDRRGLVASGFDLPTIDELSHDRAIEILIRAITSLHDNVIIIPIDGAVATAALRDQVLQLPPGSKLETTSKRRPWVKTGAADSAAVRAVHAHAGGNSNYAIVTRDSDWLQVYEAHGWPIPTIYPSLPDLREALFIITSADEAVPRILSFLARAIAQYDDRIPLGSIAGGGRLVGFFAEEQETDVYTADVELVEAVAGIDDVELVEETTALLATVYLLVQLNVTKMSYDPTDSSWSNTSRIVSDALLRCRMVFDVSDGRIMSAGPESDPVVAGGPNEDYWESEDAFSEGAIDALHALPGLHKFDWPEAFEDERSWTGALANGKPIKLNLEGSPYEEWQLTVRVPNENESDEEATLICTYNDDAWIGGSEGLYYKPPYQLWLADSPHRGSAPWHLNARILSVAYSLPRARFSAETGLDDL
jgi:hypothetical protein